MTTAATYTDAQARQLHVLTLRGWQLRITRRDDDQLVLHVIGTDPHGTTHSGRINADGRLYAEPLDPARRPEWVAVSAPAEDPS